MITEIMILWIIYIISVIAAFFIGYHAGAFYGW